MTKNGQNMAKMEKIRNMQMVDNKKDKFFYFPMISMPCTGSGYYNKKAKRRHNRLAFLLYQEILNLNLLRPYSAPAIVPCGHRANA